MAEPLDNIVQKATKALAVSLGNDGILTEGIAQGTIRLEDSDFGKFLKQYLGTIALLALERVKTEGMINRWHPVIGGKITVERGWELGILLGVYTLDDVKTASHIHDSNEALSVLEELNNEGFDALHRGGYDHFTPLSFGIEQKVYTPDQLQSLKGAIMDILTEKGSDYFTNNYGLKVLADLMEKNGCLTAQDRQEALKRRVNKGQAWVRDNVIPYIETHGLRMINSDTYESCRGKEGWSVAGSLIWFKSDYRPLIHSNLVSMQDLLEAHDRYAQTLTGLRGHVIKNIMDNEIKRTYKDEIRQIPRTYGHLLRTFDFWNV